MNTLFIDKEGKKHFKNITPETEELQTQFGIIRIKDINKDAGKAKTHKDYEFRVYEASLQEKVENMKMGSRPIYPYDSGVMCAMINIKPGSKVLEAGSGSGGNTMYMAEMGAIIDTYEREQRFQEIAEKNLSEYKNVKSHLGSVIEAKLKEEYYDTLFFDLQEPDAAIEKCDYALKHGGFVGVFTPIMDDIKPVWRKFEERGYMDIRAIQLDLKELIVKKYARVKGLMGFPGFFIWARKP